MLTPLCLGFLWARGQMDRVLPGWLAWRGVRCSMSILSPIGTPRGPWELGTDDHGSHFYCGGPAMAKDMPCPCLGWLLSLAFLGQLM